jgi:hypothetical protein
LKKFIRPIPPANSTIPGTKPATSKVNILSLNPSSEHVIFLERDGYQLQGINPLTNNYPVNVIYDNEQNITDAIITNNIEYINVGDNFYLKYL